MPFTDIVRGLGDAIAGVDRNKAFIEGQQSRAELDQTQANTDLAMETARQRRAQAAIEEQKRAARERFEDQARSAQAAADALGSQQAGTPGAPGAAQPQAQWDPSTANYADVILGELGGDFSSAMQGRNYGQAYQQNEIAGAPAGTMLGDQVVTEDMREAALDARAPAAAVGMRRPRAAGAPQIVTDPNDPTQSILIPGAGGDPITVNTPTGPVPARPRGRPAAPQGATTQERNIAALVARGVPEETAIEVVYDERPDPSRTYTAILNSTRNRYASDEEAEAAALAAVDELYGPGALDAAQEPLIQPPEEYAEGEELENPQTGQTIVLRNGVWVDKNTGQPVQ